MIILPNSMAGFRPDQSINAGKGSRCAFYVGLALFVVYNCTISFKPSSSEYLASNPSPAILAVSARVCIT